MPLLSEGIQTRVLRLTGKCLWLPVVMVASIQLSWVRGSMCTAEAGNTVRRGGKKWFLKNKSQTESAS